MKTKPSIISDRDKSPISATQASERNLPPEQQAIHPPPSFDPKNYPHYDVQSTAYCLLLSALTLVTNYERHPGFDKRQKKLADVLKDYLGTCNEIEIER